MVLNLSKCSAGLLASCSAGFPARARALQSTFSSSQRPCLFSDSLFNLADKVLQFARVLFSSAVGFEVGVVGKLAGLLLDCAFDFVNLACCLVARAQFHREVPLCSMVGLVD